MIPNQPKGFIMIALALLPENFNEILNHRNTTESLTRVRLETDVEIAALTGDICFFVPDFTHPKNNWFAPWVMIRSDALAELFDYTTPMNPTSWFDITTK